METTKLTGKLAGTISLASGEQKLMAVGWGSGDSQLQASLSRNLILKGSTARSVARRKCGIKGLLFSKECKSITMDKTTGDKSQCQQVEHIPEKSGRDWIGPP